MIDPTASPDPMALSRRAMLGAVGALLPGVAARGASAPAWVKLDTVPYPGKQDDISFPTPDVGWYGNGKGKLYATRDAGAHRELIWEKPGTFIRALAFLDEKVGIIGNLGVDYTPAVTDPNPLYITGDGGKSWAPVTHVEGPPVKGVCSIDVYREKFINFGELGTRTVIRAAGRVGGPTAMMESRDNGATWRSQDLSAVTAMILDVKFVSAKVGFLAGATDPVIEKSNALVLRTDDGGVTWKPVYRSTRPWEITWKMSFPTPEVGYVTVQNYNEDPKVDRRVVAKTTDGGRTWREIDLVRDHAVTQFGVGFLDARRGWVGTSTGGYETRDGGMSWTSVEMGTKINKIRILKTPGGFRAYAIGANVYRLDETA